MAIFGLDILMSKQQELMAQLTDMGFQADIIIYEDLPVLVLTLHNTNDQGVEHSLTLHLQYRMESPADMTYFKLYGLTEIPTENRPYSQMQMLCDFFNQRTLGGFAHISQDHTHVIYKSVLPELEEGQPELRQFFLERYLEYLEFFMTCMLSLPQAEGKV